MTDFNQLLEKKAELTERAEALQVEEVALRAQLERILDEKLEIDAQLTVIKTQAAELAKELFGLEPTVAPQPVVQPVVQPIVLAPPQPRKPDNSIVFEEPATIAPVGPPNFQI